MDLCQAKYPYNAHSLLLVKILHSFYLTQVHPEDCTFQWFVLLCEMCTFVYKLAPCFNVQCLVLSHVHFNRNIKWFLSKALIINCFRSNTNQHLHCTGIPRTALFHLPFPAVFHGLIVPQAQPCRARLSCCPQVPVPGPVFISRRAEELLSQECGSTSQATAIHREPWAGWLCVTDSFLGAWICGRPVPLGPQETRSSCRQPVLLDSRDPSTVLRAALANT